MCDNYEIFAPSEWLLLGTVIFWKKRFKMPLLSSCLVDHLGRSVGST